MKFRVSRNHIYEDTGNPRKDRLVMIARPSGILEPGVGLGKETEDLFDAIHKTLSDRALMYAKQYPNRCRKS